MDSTCESLHHRRDPTEGVLHGMAESHRPRIFISYARADGDATARKLLALLEQNKLSGWLDVHDMPTGDVISTALQQAIEGVDHLALILTPGALASSWVKQEWDYARAHGVRVSPILGADGLTKADLPPWIRDRDHVRLDDPERVTRLLGILGQEGKVDRVVYDVGETRGHFVERTAKFAELKTLLLNADGDGTTVGVTAALRGAGGYGKTTLADRLLCDPDIRFAFYDGIIRLVIGQELRDVRPHIAGIIERLTGARPPGFTDVNEAAEALQRTIGSKHLLLLIDDIWRPEQLTPFLRGGPHCVRLVTTRHDFALPDGARRIPVDKMTPDEAFQLLGWRLPPGAEGELRALAAALKGWAQLLALANGAIRRRIGRGADVVTAVAAHHALLRRKGLTAFDETNAEARERAVAASVRASLDDLAPTSRDRFIELGIFPEDIKVPVDIVAALWTQSGRLDEDDTLRLLEDFADRSLVTLCAKGSGWVLLHDTMRTFLQQTELAGERRRPAETALLAGLATRCGGDWRRAAPDEAYLWRFLLDHLTEAGRAAEARALLADFDWLSGALTALGAQTLINLYLPYTDDPALDRIHRALAMSIEALSKDPRLLAMHLWGRLGALPDGEERRLAEVARDRQPRDLPRLRHASFMPPGRERRRLVGHEGEVSSAAFSPDGTRVVTASGDRTARLWDAATGQPLGAPLRHEGGVTSAAFSPDGTRVVTASRDATARLWDGATGQPLGAALRHEGGVTSAAFSPDGTRVVTASRDATARLWDGATGQPLGAALRHEGEVVSAAFSPDGTRVVTASRDATARLWDAATGQPLGAPLRHESEVTRAAFSPDGTRVVTASWDGTARLWSATGQPLGAPLRHKGEVASAAFSPDGTRVVTASRGTAWLWDGATGQPLGAPLRHERWGTSAAFSPDGTRVVTASGDRTARLWDGATGQPLGAPLRHEREVTSAAFSPDGTRVVTASWDRTARLWDAVPGPPLGVPLRHEGKVISAAFSPDGTRVVTASTDGTARLWDAVPGQPLGAPLRHKSEVISAMFSPDGTRVVTASGDRTARLWDAATGQPLGAPLRHEGKVISAAFSPDGTRVVTTSGDGTTRLWDAATGQPLGAPLRHEGGVTSAVFSPDGTRVVTASWDRTARLWGGTTGPLGAPLRHEGEVASAAFSPDGTRVVTVSWGTATRLWDGATGQPLGAPLRHEAGVTSAAFSPDGTRILTASEDNTARLWDGATGQPLGAPLRHEGGVTSAAFSPDGTRVVSVSRDRTLRLWQAETGAPRLSVYMDAATTTLGVARDLIVVGDALGGMHIFDGPDDPSPDP